MGLTRREALSSIAAVGGEPAVKDALAALGLGPKSSPAASMAATTCPSIPTTNASPPLKPKASAATVAARKAATATTPWTPSPPPCYCKVGWTKTPLYLNPD